MLGKFLNTEIALLHFPGNIKGPYNRYLTQPVSRDTLKSFWTKENLTQICFLCFCKMFIFTFSLSFFKRRPCNSIQIIIHILPLLQSIIPFGAALNGSNIRKLLDKMLQVESLRRNKWLRASATYRFSADTFFGDFFFSLGNDLSCSNPSLSKSCRIAILASCSISLNVSLILRNTEKKCSLDLVLTLIMSGKSSVAFFSSWVISTQRITNFAEQKQTEKKDSVLKNLAHSKAFIFLFL